MRVRIFEALAGILVAALMLLVQAAPSHAASAMTGFCAEVACSLPGTESEAGKLDPSPPPQRLAKIELKLKIGCPHGFHWDGEECVFNRRHGEHRVECPDGMRWDGEDCVWARKAKKRGGDGCVVGYHRDGDRCVPDREREGGGGCVVGFHWNGDHCVPDRKRKVEGECSVLFGDYCAPDAQGKKKGKGCPEGTEFVNGKCRKSEFPPIEGQEGGGDDGFSCSHNDHLENGKCVPCKEGFHVEGDECVAD